MKIPAGYSVPGQILRVISRWTWVSKKELFEMMLNDNSNLASFQSFDVIFCRLNRQGYFDIRPSPYSLQALQYRLSAEAATLHILPRRGTRLNHPYVWFPDGMRPRWKSATVEMDAQP